MGQQLIGVKDTQLELKSRLMHVVHQVELPIEFAVQCLARSGACCKAPPAACGQGARIAGKIEQPLCTVGRSS
eukprot:3691896-Amphidinium_carterae.1